ncbi:MAG: cytochrome c3 family protein [Candidatus Lindowbacteria bacterium]|nr:cytochrome c3 family protein [Candidatus Lindowbacteria bacterium]
MKFIGAVVLVLAFASSVAAAKVGGGEITFSVKDAGPVTFSHDIHVGKLGSNCTECHAELYVTKEKHVKVTMEEMKEGLSCGACHNGEKAFNVEEDCERCHTQQ